MQLATFLHPLQKLTDGPVEFVKFDEKMFDEIEKEIREVENKSQQQAFAQLVIMAKRASLLMSTPDSTPITVRLFEDGEERYVMKEELHHALNRLSTGFERFEIRNDGFIYNAMSFEEVKAEFGDRIMKIEFIRTPILRTKHRATPIRSHFPEQFVIPAVDCFFEFWRNVILGVKLFQKYQCSDWEKFAPSFHNIEEYFDIEKKQQYFVRADIRVESVVGNSLTEFEVSSINEVRNVNKDGFTARNLKNELKYLGLTVTFSEIQEYAEDVYEEIDKAKKERKLRTCDLFDAVESCQLICVLNRIPKLKMFLHNQKGCGRVIGYKCEHCGEEKKMPDALEISQQPAEVQKTSDIQDSMKNLRIKSSTEPIQNQCSQSALSTSKDCEKCTESSKTLKETDNELKISKDQSKETQQKITNTAKELSDLKKEDEKIVESEAKKTEELAEIKEALSEKKEQIQEKEEEIQKTILKLTPVYKPIPERFKTVSKPETEKFDIEATNSHENSIADVNEESKKSEAEVEILRQKLVEKEEEIVNFKRDALIHEKTVKEFKELKEKIAEYKAREKEIIEGREREALAHSKTVLENKRLMRENASFRSQLKDSNERIKSEIDTRDKEIEKLGKKIANYEKKRKNDESIRAEIKKENEKLKKKIEEEKQRNEATLEELSNLKMRLEVSEAQMSEARSQYEITIERLEKENQELKGSNELYGNNFNSINETIHRERQTFGTVQQLEQFNNSTTAGLSISSAPTPPPSGPSTSSWNHQNPTRDSELEECMICLIDIKQREKTIKCDQCRHRFHSKCASDWLKVKSECPACRGRLLDPQEFPAL
ncbi:hypothetical protein CRE_30562 [Caenorhabditis remanei]|uniref:RING-type domain-containing protein n=1 Tax=Caenorhabditis remanei TaxID=31234 RepID=E3NN82_CAERE|nr:hypothetical protein CRE_30562 [Caenorhabditis remanei]